MNKRFKRVISFFLSFAVCVCAFGASSGVLYNSNDSKIAVSAESPIIDSGSCGENLTWRLTEDNVLTISGSGDMYNYIQGTAPWYNYNAVISEVVMGDNIANVGDYAFYNCGTISQINTPKSITRIGDHAFENCESITSGTIYDTLQYMGVSAFENCTSFNTINIIRTLDDINDINITIGANAFKGIKVNTISYNGNESELREIYRNIIAGTAPNVKLDVTVFEFLTTLAMDIKNNNIELVTLEYIIGDVNCDNKVDSNDLILLKRYSLGLETLEGQAFNNADITLDGEVNSIDIIKLKQMLLGSIALG